MSKFDADKSPDDIAAAEYVLGLLSPEDRLAFEKRLNNEPDLQKTLAFWEIHFAVLNDEIDEVRPPAGLFEKVERRLFDGADDQKADSFLVWLWRNVGVWRAIAALAVIAIVFVSAQNLTVVQPRDDSGSSVTYIGQLTSADAPYKVATLFEPSSGILKLNREEGVIKSGRSLELWLIEDGQAPVSLGLLPAAAKGELTIAKALRDKMPTGLLAITDEPLGGGPGGKPTGAVVASGKLTEM